MFTFGVSLKRPFDENRVKLIVETGAQVAHVWRREGTDREEYEEQEQRSVSTPHSGAMSSAARWPLVVRYQLTVAATCENISSELTLAQCTDSSAF